ncbi:RNA-dependent RNA polymerase [Colletotrichum higginsianum non-segmented dsRNA virus 1]|uniref:RNA-dependent RNA polymerase n=1 Tax=Colletotrichum higginsianum non-segmented dsRNA virus 1 TaxID=1565088 RepID=A0A0N7A5G0_9VIRU|nr:RNA-dependent RNA polymerase [Colletotrichum higginsianum non-segmented dsRNA virus 1]AIW81425.1 RNA-dependent RNA polymerase [Colletotrichum higginsianum non-segmented dsRNA virus 1]
MTEASGLGVKDWSFFLEPAFKSKELRGVRCLGFSKGLKYKYVQPQTKNSQFFLSFLDQCTMELAGIPGPSLEITTSEYVPPSESDLFAHIAGFGESGSSGSQLSNRVYAALREELTMIEHWDREITGWLDPRLLVDIKVPSQTSPGIRWKKLGYKTKKEALMPATMEAAKVLLSMIETGTEYEVPPCGVAGRGKRMDMNRKVDTGGKKEGRLIVMPDLVRHLVGTLGSGAYMSKVKEVDKSQGGILLGMGPFSESYQSIANWARGASKFVFLDFKKFDHRVPARVLQEVFKHIASRYEGCPGSKAYWRSEFQQLVNTKIAMPDGTVYQKKRGVASGDPWTSIAGSYANWMMLKHVCNVLGLVAKIWTFGDDSVIALYDVDPTLDLLPLFTKHLASSFGMHVSQEKSYVSDCLVDIAEDPEPKSSGSFLSLYFLQTPMGVRPTRPLQDMYEMMMVPERNQGTLRWEIVRTSMAYLTFYYNDRARYVLEEYWDWLHRKYRVPELKGNFTDLNLLREMDIPWSSFKLEWLVRLPRPGEVELMYKYGHTGFFPPLLWGHWYARYDRDVHGNNVSFAFQEPPT